VLLLTTALVPTSAGAGPPFVTDDPEPVEYRHWEFYLASQNELTHDEDSGTCPHVEINYGALPDLQLHLITPLAYSRPSGGPTAFGVGDLELGAKLRFVQETPNVPMIGIFPQLELPVGSESRGLGAGHLRAFLPLWLQKSRGPWTTYGGGGYWLNPGDGNQNYWLAGWLVQRALSAHAALGAEIFATTPDHPGGRGSVRFDLGSVLDLTEHHHILLSAGHSIAGDEAFQGYVGYQFTI
jgi:hypothetical protein